MTGSLRAFVDDLAAERRTVTVYADDPPADLGTRLRDWNVEVRYDRLPPDTAGGFVTVREGDRFLGSVPLETVATLFEPPARHLTSEPDHAPRHSLEPLLELLDETLFRSFERRQLLAATREIEDRAFRVGQGELHAGFQHAAALSAQRTVYERLAHTALDVHVYADAEWPEPPIPGTILHTEPGGELGQFWFVAFVPPEAGDRSQACALLAEERSPGSYDGFWTYDPDRVRTLVEYLRTAHGDA